MVVQIVTMYTDLPQYRFIELLNTVQLLHDILIPLNNDIQGALSLKTAIARICEHWWKKNESGAENLITQLIPFLLLSSLGPDAIDADVKRLYQIREAIALLDFEDPSIESIRTLILRCFIHPAFLRNAEGQKFLSFVFTLSPALHQYILEVMKPQLAAGIKTIATCYGEILYRAWKDSKSDGHNNISINQQSLEELFQLVVHESIHAADQKYFRSLRTLMKVFHDHKRLKDVDSMLLRIYGPILWRSLRCANAIVRSQASTLFFDAFPLQDSDGTAAEVDVILQKQFDLLTSLLKDEDHRVRATAASGVCHILTEYWEALPSATTRQILSFIVGTLGFDASSANVRLAVLTGLNELLEQPLSHNILKNLLPLLGNAIHDKSEKNRLAFIKILSKVKSIQNMHFYKIVTVDNLLLRLADDEDKPAVSKAMTSLLVNSFYPQGNDLSFDIAKVSRCLKLIRQNLPAAQAFYGNLIFNDVTVGSVSKFSWLLFSLFLSEKHQLEALLASEEKEDEEYDADAEVKTKRGRARGKANNEEEFNLATSIMTDSHLQAGILNVILSCLTSIKSKLKDAKESKSFIEGRFNEVSINKVLKRISSIDADESSPSIPIFMRIISILVDLRMGNDQNFSPIDSKMVVRELDEIMEKSSANYKSQMIASIELLCTLGRKDILIDKVQSTFSSFLKSKNKNDKSDSLKGAVEILCLLIESDNAIIAATRDEIISKEEETFNSLFISVKEILATALKSDKFINARETFLHCAHVWSSYAVRKTFASKLTDDSGLATVEEVESLVHWVTDNVVSVICSFDASEYKKKLAQQVLASVMLVFTDALMLDVGVSVILEAFIDWTRTLDIYTSHCQEQGHDEYPIRFLIPMLARVSFMITNREKLIVSSGQMKMSVFSILKNHCGLLIADISNEAADKDPQEISIAKLAAGKAIISNLKMSSTSDFDPMACFINSIIDNMITFKEFKTNSSKFCYELLKLSPETVQSKSIAYITAFISFMLGATNGSMKLYSGFAPVSCDNQNKNQMLKDLCHVLNDLSSEGSEKHIEHSKTLITNMFDIIMRDPQVDKENYDITKAFSVLEVR